MELSVVVNDYLGMRRQGVPHLRAFEHALQRHGMRSDALADELRIARSSLLEAADLIPLLRDATGFE